MTNRIAIIGAGPIAIEYSKILTKLEQEYIVIGRGESSANSFKQATGRDALVGGIDKNKEAILVCNKAIVAVSEDQLDIATVALLELGIKDILVEKPGASTIEKVQAVKDLAQNKNAKVHLAYNRRYFSSVLELEKRILNDGGLKSFHFEFTEWSHVIQDIPKNPGVKENWFFQNSSHVIDLAFHLGGSPLKMNSLKTSELDWHPNGSNFVGSGISEKHALFTYQANWKGPGRWALEFITATNRYYLKPMEQLQVQELGSVAVNKIEVDDSLDQEFKPGFFLQTKDFIENKKGNLISIEEQNSKSNIYLQILNGEN
ncbi:Gfo/Idh/MocA family oxidoreductase [Halobacteriovorax sp. HLS]|uniref:Gfo/Idh/MocA family oxidoreductase n=1 Tax=Halobacteriovorax sp. HLS TaxID=2234000 RepID=UPI000FD8CE63|nr:Gfo/Idh/MocA family oxidoreductase [Halobacteriovorax sp. HLS]